MYETFIVYLNLFQKACTFSIYVSNHVVKADIRKNKSMYEIDSFYSARIFSLTKMELSFASLPCS